MEASDKEKERFLTTISIDSRKLIVIHHITNMPKQCSVHTKGIDVHPLMLHFHFPGGENFLEKKLHGDLRNHCL